MTTTANADFMANSTDLSSAQSSTAAPARTLSPRVRIARLILLYHFALIIISSIYYLLKGFDSEEFTLLMGLLAPITALYGGAVFRFIGKTITDSSAAGNGSDPDVSGLVKMLVHGHFITVLILISMKAVFNFISFQDMVMFFTLVETGVGVYMGNILLALFENKTADK